MKPIMIQLNENVVISDPSIVLGDKNYIEFDNVKPGNFYVFHKIYNCGAEGNKIGKMMVVHEEHLNDVLPWIKRGLFVNVKSGLAGIFTKDTYRKDDIFLKKSGLTLGLPVGMVPEGGDWFGHMFEKVTSSPDKHGTYFKGCVCNTPTNDKKYEVHIARFRRRPVGIMIDFGMDNTRYAKYDWWTDKKPITAL